MKKILKSKIDSNQKIPTKEYVKTLSNIKQQIKNAQTKSILAANRELIKLYWTIGKTINEKQEEYGWGSNFVEKLSKDIQELFKGIEGFSPRNVFRMRAFYLAYQKVTQAVSLFENLPMFNIPWGHNIILMIKLKNEKERMWYAQQAIDNGWSRSALEDWIKSDLYNRVGKAITNFKQTLPNPDSNIAQESLKDPYVFDFLTLQDNHIEYDIEQGLINHIQKLLLELGKGFSFIGRQYHLEVAEEDYYIDLLFYHYKLRCFVVVEIKARKFSPKDVGQLNFYLSAVDDLLRHPDDNPTIGLLLCKTKNNVTVEYALRSINRPIGVAKYETEIIKNLPKEFKSSLPTVEEIEAELEKKEIFEEKKEIKKRKNKKS